MNITHGFKQPHQTIKSKHKNSSQRWIDRQINDPFVALAKQNGYRARASFKIIEIDDKFRIFKKGLQVLDLGSAPGGWSQVAVQKVGSGNVLAVDLLEMQPIGGVDFVRGDFLQDTVREQILAKCDKYDIIMSDMATNTTGNKSIDHLRTANLVEEAFNFSTKVLRSGGIFISKIFQGGAEPELFKQIKQNFDTIKHFKPKSSRQESVEMYIVALGYNGTRQYNE